MNPHKWPYLKIMMMMMRRRSNKAHDGESYKYSFVYKSRQHISEEAYGFVLLRKKTATGLTWLLFCNAIEFLIFLKLQKTNAVYST